MLLRIATPNTAEALSRRNWTIGDLLEWIALDDARCHDESLRTDLVDALAASGDGAARGAVVMLVRALAQRTGDQPALRETLIRDTAPNEIARVDECA